MSDMSDLDLVAQAMAPTEPTNDKPSTPNRQTDEGQSAQVAPPTADENHSDLPDLSQIPGLADLDASLLASLSLEDRQALLPLIQALQRSSPSAGAAASGVDEEGDEAEMAELLRQMEAAGSVADELEDKLDRLIRQLGEEEKGLEGSVGAALGGKGREEDKGDKAGTQ